MSEDLPNDNREKDTNHTVHDPCPRCDGEGIVTAYELPCGECGGTGLVEVETDA